MRGVVTNLEEDNRLCLTIWLDTQHMIVFIKVLEDTLDIMPAGDHDINIGWFQSLPALRFLAMNYKVQPYSFHRNDVT